jgi:Lamin Tail Domain
MATTVFPSTLTFNRGLSLAPQVRAVTITGQNVIVTVADSPPGGTFRWRGSPPQGWLLNPPPELPAVIPVTFTPSSMAPVQAIMTVNVVRNDATHSGIPGFPVDVVLEGNANGVGPGTLKINRIVANPPGPDLPEEFIEIINVSNTTLDLQGCRVGDFRGSRGPRLLYTFGSSYTLDPVADATARGFLRIFTGPGVAPDPAFLQIPLKRDAPVWNNAGDTGWIKNPLDQLVDTFVYPTGGSPPPVAPGPASVTTAIVIPPNGIMVDTGISVEEGDRLSFAASGQIWVGVGVSGGESGPDGKGPDPAGIGWPAPDLPPISLFGTIGSTGRPFLVGSASTHVVDNEEGRLFLGVNDYNLGDNWGSGYTCIVIRTRPQ